MLIPLLKLKPSCPVTAAMVRSLFSTIAETHYTQYHKWKRHISHSHLNCQIPPGSPLKLVLQHPYAVSFPAFAAMVTAFCYYHTNAGSVIITLPAVLVDNIYRIGSSLRFLFLTFGPDLRCGPTVGTLQSSSTPPIQHL